MIDDWPEMLNSLSKLQPIRRGNRLIEHLTDVDDPHGKRSYLHDTNLSGRYRMSSISYTGLAAIACWYPYPAKCGLRWNIYRLTNV